MAAPSSPKPKPPPMVRPATFWLWPVTCPAWLRTGSLSPARRATITAAVAARKRVFDSLACTPPSLSTLRGVLPVLSAACRLACVRTFSLSWGGRSATTGMIACNRATSDGNSISRKFESEPAAAVKPAGSFRYHDGAFQMRPLRQNQSVVGGEHGLRQHRFHLFSLLGRSRIQHRNQPGVRHAVVPRLRSNQRQRSLRHRLRAKAQRIQQFRIKACPAGDVLRVVRQLRQQVILDLLLLARSAHEIRNALGPRNLRLDGVLHLLLPG